MTQRSPYSRICGNRSGVKPEAGEEVEASLGCQNGGGGRRGGHRVALETFLFSNGDLHKAIYLSNRAKAAAFELKRKETLKQTLVCAPEGCTAKWKWRWWL
ncbi:hypothetical protein M407DRAFT_220512 [Tulasnella calospora MUT 4182]|uniref:Uncharacterized protein n=1 Tax=Tulasnella calospora MUT 4182 TaxID=1051891 RepID=A0A0C3LBU9_9AGAM|nr:hypothetical protein M407DRAFT_220512 [Tulasnella calospora MUT 4182]